MRTHPAAKKIYLKVMKTVWYCFNHRTEVQKQTHVYVVLYCKINIHFNHQERMNYPLEW